MKLVIDIPVLFEQHFKNDRFSDSLHRLYEDAHSLAGLYERETAVMLIDAFKNAVTISDEMTQEEFMTCIIKEICDYAVDNRMIPDDTLLTVADNIIKLVSISTFNGWKKGGLP